MSMYVHQANITLPLHVNRCGECGRFFASERDSYFCVACSEKRVASLREEVARISRANASLRGLLAKRSKRSGE